MAQTLGYAYCLNHKVLIMKDEEKADRNVDARIIIDEVLKTVGMTPPKFAEAIGINYQRVFDLQRGRTKKFNPGVVNKICTRFPQISKTYLYTGEGDVTVDVASIPASASGIDSASMAEFMSMSQKLLQLMEQLQAKDSMLSDRAMELMERERDLNERERLINKREYELDKRES